MPVYNNGAYGLNTYSKPMRKNIILLVIAILLTAGVTGAAMYKWNHRAHVPAGISIQEALNQKRDAEIALSAKTAATNYKLTQKDNTISTLTIQKAAICQYLAERKLTNPTCSQ